MIESIQPFYNYTELDKLPDQVLEDFFENPDKLFAMLIDEIRKAAMFDPAIQRMYKSFKDNEWKHETREFYILLAHTALRAKDELQKAFFVVVMNNSLGRAFIVDSKLFE